MYLASLSQEEKELFLGLALVLAASDGEYSDDEKTIIEGYCQEMQLSIDQEKTIMKSVDDLIGKLSVFSNEKSKRILVFEAIGLAMADGHYDKREKELITKIEKELNMETEFANKCEAVMNEYILFQGRINELILG
jgi:tellurite resistance protein|nr:hypothetical protein [uncultured Acetatifactor sp.]